MHGEEDLKQILKYLALNGRGVIVYKISTKTKRRNEPVILYNRGGKNKEYLGLDVKGKKYSAHRAVWALTHGKWPDNQIDHIDHNPHNNHIINLRDVTNGQNISRNKPAKGKRSKYKGVRWYSKGLKHWRMNIQYNGHKVEKYFVLEEDAARCYDHWAIKLHGIDYAYLNFPEHN